MVARQHPRMADHPGVRARTRSLDLPTLRPAHRPERATPRAHERTRPPHTRQALRRRPALPASSTPHLQPTRRRPHRTHRASTTTDDQVVNLDRDTVRPDRRSATARNATLPHVRTPSTVEHDPPRMAQLLRRRVLHQPAPTLPELRNRIRARPRRCWQQVLLHRMQNQGLPATCTEAARATVRMVRRNESEQYQGGARTMALHMPIVRRTDPVRCTHVAKTLCATRNGSAAHDRQHLPNMWGRHVGTKDDARWPIPRAAGCRPRPSLLPW